MQLSRTRRDFLTQVVTATLMGRGLSAAAVAGTETPLKTQDPFDQLGPDLERLITEVMTQLDVPGLSIALIRKAQVAWTRDFGVRDKQTGKAVDAATVFEAASLTKPVLAYAALALCEDGRLELDKPLAPFLPEPFTDEQPELLAQVTPRHVLTHTTGFPNWRARGRSLKFRRPPGEKFSYSGEGFVYLQQVVEQLTGAPLDEYLHEKLFDPLHMTSASLVWNDTFENNLARGYAPRGNSKGLRRKWTKPNAASSLVCTADDYAKFVCALLVPPAAVDGMLALKNVAQIWKPQVEAAQRISWGLGVGVEHTPQGDAFWHWGNNGSRYNCFFAAFPQHQIGIVVFTNSGNGLKACAEIVPAAIGGEHPAFDWKMVVR